MRLTSPREEAWARLLRFCSTASPCTLIYRLLARARVFVTLLPFAAVLFAGTQLAGLVLDRLDRTGLFPTSYDVVARRPRA